MCCSTRAQPPVKRRINCLIWSHSGVRGVAVSGIRVRYAVTRYTNAYQVCQKLQLWLLNVRLCRQNYTRDAYDSVISCILWAVYNAGHVLTKALMDSIGGDLAWWAYREYALLGVWQQFLIDLISEYVAHQKQWQTTLWALICECELEAVELSYDTRDRFTNE